MFSVDRVRIERLAGRRTEDLVQRVNDEVPVVFFLPAETEEVIRANAKS